MDKTRYITIEEAKKDERCYRSTHGWLVQIIRAVNSSVRSKQVDSLMLRVQWQLQLRRWYGWKGLAGMEGDWQVELASGNWKELMETNRVRRRLLHCFTCVTQIQILLFWASSQSLKVKFVCSCLTPNQSTTYTCKKKYSSNEAGKIASH